MNIRWPDSQHHDGVPRGSVTQYSWTSKIFPGPTRDYGSLANGEPIYHLLLSWGLFPTPPVVGNSTIGNRVLRGGIGAFDGAGRTVTAAGPVGSLETAGTPFTPHQLSKNSGFPAGIVDGRSWIAHVDRAAAPAGSNYGAPLRCFRGRSLWSLLGFCIAVDLEPTETLEGDCQKWWSTASKRPRGGSAIREGGVF